MKNVMFALMAVAMLASCAERRIIFVRFGN